MEKSFVLFGPAHHGKSTLAGYLTARFAPDFNLGEFDQKMRCELGHNYDKKQKFAYIVDTRKDERARDPLTKHGTSRYMHRTRVRVADVATVVIDTPGSEYAERERTKGVFLGDVGVFMIELARFRKLGPLAEANLDLLREFFTPLFVWTNFKKGRGAVLIVVSKMDEGGFSESEYLNAVAVIQKACDVQADAIIPTAIDVAAETDENVTGRSKNQKLSWYDRRTFLEALRESLAQAETNPADVPPFLCVSKFYDKEFIGPVVEGKLLQGTLRKKDAVKIMPVHFRHQDFVPLTAQARTIHPAGEPEEIDEATAGMIIGINLSDTKVGDRRCEKHDFDLVETSCVVHSDCVGIMGNVLRFNIDKGYADDIHVMETVRIPWFGRFVAGRVIRIAGNEGYAELDIELETLHAALPEGPSGTLFCKDFLIRLEPKTFIAATLRAIGIPGTLTVQLPGATASDQVLKGYFGDLKPDITQNELRFRCPRTYIDVVSRIRRYRERLTDTAENICRTIQIEMAEGSKI